MQSVNLSSHLPEGPHRRLNPLTGDYILVSPHRGRRPWKGEVSADKAVSLPAHDPNCPLCPGGTRQGQIVNEEYTSTYVFTNDFPAILPPEQNRVGVSGIDGIIFAAEEYGTSRVICFSPYHNLTLAEMEVDDIVRVTHTWTTEYESLGKDPYIGYVSIFENKGAIMGSSMPHPHGQIWATSSIPTLPSRSLSNQLRYFKQHGTTLLETYLKWELERPEERIVCQNDHWVALVPYWAQWPFETMILPKAVVTSICDLSDEQRRGWAELLKELLVRYDNLFLTSMPYSMGLYQKPTDGGTWEGTVMYQMFFPPLLRSSTVRKYMAGFELMSEAQRDITPESAALRLRQCSTVHYKAKVDYV